MTANARDPATPEEQAEALAELIEKARRQPGVAEVMKVYEGWRSADEAARPYLQTMTTRQIVSLSDNSGPCVRGLK